MVTLHAPAAVRVDPFASSTSDKYDNNFQRHSKSVARDLRLPCNIVISLFVRPGSRSSGRVASGSYGIYSNALARLSCARPHFYYSPLSFSLFVLFPLPFKPYNDLTRRNRSDIVQPFKSLCIWIKTPRVTFSFTATCSGLFDATGFFQKLANPIICKPLKKSVYYVL